MVDQVKITYESHKALRKDEVQAKLLKNGREGTTS